MTPERLLEAVEELIVKFDNFDYRFCLLKIRDELKSKIEYAKSYKEKKAIHYAEKLIKLLRD